MHTRVATLNANGRTSATRRRVRELALTAAATAAAALLLAGAASAANMFTLDAHADGLGQLAMDSAGNVYVGWNRTNGGGAADTPMFCKFALGSTCTSPVALTLPGPNAPDGNGTDGDFPILGSGHTVYVVGPRYVDKDTVVWTSTDGGATFGAATVIANGFDQTSAESVLLDGSNLLIGGVNVGLSFDSTPLTGTAGSAFVFTGGGTFITSGALALDTSGNPVEAYWNDNTPAALQYYYYTGSGSMDSQSNWAGPVAVGVGQTPSLVGGAGGLQLLSADGSLASNPNDPTAVDVRTYNSTTHTFGSPVKLLTNPASGFDVGGGLAETPAGKVVAIWPDVTAGGADVLDSFVSTNGGATFTGATQVATRAGGYTGQASVAAIDVGTSLEGVVAFTDSNGLELANLNPIAQPTTLTTVQRSGSVAGASITIPAGTVGETDTAAVGGANAATATGTVAYALFSSPTCSAPSKVFSGSGAVTGGVASPAAVTSGLAPGKYYWVAAYGGDATNDASVSTCGSEVLDVVTPVSIGAGGSSSKTTITITVSCAVVPCKVTVLITVDPKKKTVTIAKGTFTITKPGAQKLAVKLTRAGKRLIKKDHGKVNKATAAVETTIDGHLDKISRTIKITPGEHKK